MPIPSKILILAGSARAESYNKKLARLAATATEKLGAKVTFLDLKEYPLPLFDEDLETAEGLPNNAVALKDAFKANNGILFACPEYNSSVTPLWKNTIDWCSRSSEDESPLVCFKNKIIALVSASPGALGGLRGLVHYRQILGNIGSFVIPDQMCVSAAYEAFNEDGSLKDTSQLQKLEGVVKSLVYWTDRA